MLAAKAKGIPMRIGANSGSLPKHLIDLANEDQAEALVEAALEEVRLLEKLDYRDFKISVKSSHVPTMIRAYRLLASKVPYPLHLGVTEAGTPFAGSIKSAVGIGRAARRRDRRHDSRLADGRPGRRGEDGIRDPEGARAARARAGDDRLPECGRDNVGVQQLAERVEERLHSYPRCSRSRCSAAP